MVSVRRLFPAVFFALFLFAATVLAVAAQDRGRQTATPASPAAATVAVAHFAPFASEVISTSVDVLVNGSVVITDFVFAEKVTGLSLAAGTYTISVAPSGSSTPVLTITPTVSDGVDYTLAAIGGANGWPLEIYPIVNDNSPFTATGKIRITHLSPFAATLAGTEVDICTQAGDAVPGLTGLAYKESTGYLPLAAGRYDLTIAVTGSDCATVAYDIPVFDLRIGQVADIYAIGLPGSASLPLQLAQSGLTARLAVGHLAPFASSPVSTSVSVNLAGSDVLTGFVFPTITPYLEVAPGSYAVKITPTGAVTPAISVTAVLTGFIDYTAAAIGNGSLQPLELLALVDDNVTVPPTGTARLRVTHAAPFSSTLAATAVDLCAWGSTTPVAAGLEYKQSVTLDLPAGVYALDVSLAGTNCAGKLFSIPPFSVKAGDIAYVYAVGDGVNATPTVLVTPGVGPASFNFLSSVRNEHAVELPDIVETAQAAGSFSLLLTAVDAAGLTDTLKGPGPFTVFAPTDAAFNALPAGVLSSLLADVPALQNVLLYHVVGNTVYSPQLYDGMEPGMVNGDTTTITRDDQGNFLINGARIVTADIYADNGVIHVIDAVLIPPQ